MVELLALSIGTPLAYLACAWRYAVWHHRRHKNAGARTDHYGNFYRGKLPNGRHCCCETSYESASFALLCAVWWPLSIAFIAIPAISQTTFDTLANGLDKSADRPAPPYARYVPFLCARHHAERDKRIAELERELGSR